MVKYNAKTIASPKFNYILELFNRFLSVHCTMPASMSEAFAVAWRWSWCVPRSVSVCVAPPYFCAGVKTCHLMRRMS